MPDRREQSFDEEDACTMKIALFVPLMADENTTPALGPLYLLSMLEKEGIDGRLFDARIDCEALDRLIEFRPDLVGISAATAGYNRGLAAARKVKEHFSEVPVAFGGPHPTAMPESVIREPWVDFVFTHEAELPFAALCKAHMGGSPSKASLLEIENLLFMDSGRVVKTKRRDYLSSAELDMLPMPAFHRMDLEKYFNNTQTHGLFRKGNRILPVMSSRGCPNTCTFCCRMMGRRMRVRSPEGLIQEIQYLRDRYGIDEVYFEDDNFTVLRDRALDILERFARLEPPLYLKFANGIRADQVDRELLIAMKNARVYSLSFGIESGSVSTLTKMKKNLDLDKARSNVMIARSMGFLVGSNCIIGYPGETPQDIRESLDFFFKLPLDSMAIVNLIPFPGTEAREVAEREGCLSQEAQDWDNYYFSINDPITLIETPQLSGEETRRLVKQAYRRMYMRPQWILRNFNQFSFKQMMHGASRLLFPDRKMPSEDT